MDKEMVLIMILVSVTLLTEIAVAQPAQWPPVYDNHNRYPSPYQAQVSGAYGNAWHSNYVSPNYNPYINQQQGFNYVPVTNARVLASPYYARTNPGHYSMATSSMAPIYRNPLVMPPSTMTYNPWLSSYGVMPIMALPLMPLPGYGY